MQMQSLTITSKPKSFGSYAEVSQTSPMRWRVYFADKDNVLHPQSNWWKCKDFLNDTVFFLATGKGFSIYGYNGAYEVNDPFVYVGVKDIPTDVPFLENLKVLNSFLNSQRMPEIEVELVEGVQYMLVIHRVYFENTFYISAITSLIRGCVYGTVKTIDDIFAAESTISSPTYKKSVTNWLSPKTREKFKKIVYLNYQYHGDTYNSVYNVHDAGLQSWTNSPMSKEF
jgi:hypothetical protein